MFVLSYLLKNELLFSSLFAMKYKMSFVDTKLSENPWLMVSIFSFLLFNIVVKKFERNEIREVRCLLVKWLWTFVENGRTNNIVLSWNYSRCGHLPDTRRFHCLFLGRIWFEESNRPNLQRVILETARRSCTWTLNSLGHGSHDDGSTRSVTRSLTWITFTFYLRSA